MTVPQLAAGPDGVDEALLRRWHDIRESARARDVPGLPAEPYADLLADARVGSAAERSEVWVAGGGGYRLVLTLTDNPDLAEVELVVGPQHRRRGVGRALLDHASRRARAEGRARIVLWGGLEPLAPAAPEAPGSAFARAVGARRVTEEIQRALDLPAVDEAAWARARAEAEAAAADYEVIAFAGAAPDSLAPGLAALKHQISVDAPTDDLTVEGARWDVQRWRHLEDETVAKGRRRYVALARHRGDGHVAALTDLAVAESDPAQAHQWDTVVLPADRGHRLGLLVKLANLEQLRRLEPAARRVTTYNATSNAHMVAVNDRLGFAPAARVPVWELAL